MDYFDKKVGPFLKTLGFKFDDQFQWVLGKDKNITVHGDKVSMKIRLSSLYNHKSRFGRRTVNIEDGKKYLKDNIKELKQLEKDPNNKKLGNALSKKLNALEEVDDEETRKSKSLRFKNMWLHYNFSKPSNATKGILYSVDVKDMQQLNKDALAIVSPILKGQKFKIVDTGFNDGISYYEPANKKESKKIPYVRDLIDSQDEDDLDWGGIEMAGIIVNCYKGKYKGVGKDASLYYFVLMIGGFTVDDTEKPTVAVEVITPLDKGEQFFLGEVKKAVSKLNVWKFTGKAIKVNKCPKAVTGSAEMKPYSYKGQVITASSKEEAIAQIVKSGAIGDFFKRLLHQETYLGQHLEKNKNKYDVCTRNIASLIVRFVDYDKARSDLNDKNFVISFLDTANKAAGIIQDVAEKTSSNDEKALLDFRYVVSKQLHRVYDWVDNNTNRAMDANLTTKDCENFANNALKEYGKK